MQQIFSLTPIHGWRGERGGKDGERERGERGGGRRERGEREGGEGEREREREREGGGGRGKKRVSHILYANCF